MKKMVICLAFACSVIGLSGCNTVAGLGQDIKKGSQHVSQALGKAGDKITETADSHR